MQSMNGNELYKLGNFINESGVLFISDPCYDIDTWCTARVKAKTGEWISFVEKSDEGDWGNRCAVLFAYHKDYPLTDSDDININCSGIGVDSGQAGIFDEKYFKDDSVATPSNFIPDEPWYSMCCSKTLSKKQADVIPYGAVSSSGYGDGVYSYYVKENESGEVVAVKIVFIGDEICTDCGEMIEDCMCDEQ